MGLFDFQKTKTITCELCGEVAPMRSPSQRYCTACARARDKELKIIRQRENREKKKRMAQAQKKELRPTPPPPPKENRKACDGCAHDSNMGGARCCEYMCHQIDYVLPKRPHPTPMAQECLYYSKKPWDAGRLPEEVIEHLMNTPGRPVINTHTGEIYANAEEAAEKAGWKKARMYYIASKKRVSTVMVEEYRFFSPEEMKLLTFHGVKKRPVCNRTVGKT